MDDVIIKKIVTIVPFIIERFILLFLISYTRFNFLLDEIEWEWKI